MNVTERAKTKAKQPNIKPNIRIYTFLENSLNP